MGRTPKPTDELPEDHEQTIHVRVNKRALMNLDKIRERMKRDPLIGPMHINPGRARAVLYAIAQCAEHGPARISSAG